LLSIATLVRTTCI